MYENENQHCSSVDKIDTRQFLFNRTFVRECTLQVYDIQRVIKWEIIIIYNLAISWWDNCRNLCI